MKRAVRVASLAAQGLLWSMLLGYAALVVLPRLTPYDVLIVRGGSMEPTIGVGSVVVVDRAARTVGVGDVVSFRQPDGSIITHRIVASEAGLFTTRGDANRADDLGARSPDTVVGRAVTSVPLVGYLLRWLQLPIVFLGLLGVTGGALIVGELHVIRRELRRLRRPEATSGG